MPTESAANQCYIGPGSVMLDVDFNRIVIKFSDLNSSSEIVTTDVGTILPGAVCFCYGIFPSHGSGMSVHIFIQFYTTIQIPSILYNILLFASPNNSQKIEK